MNTRSITFRLISWYTCLITLMCIGFGAYTYQGLKSHLYESLENTFKRRTSLLSEGILPYLHERGSDYTINEIKTIFSTEQNNRFMRITYEDGKILYASGRPKDELFDPTKISPVRYPVSSPFIRKWKINHNVRLIILTSPVILADGSKFVIEVGETTESINDTLYALLWALYVGLPFVLILTAAGGYLLIRNSLRPVEKIRIAAEDISLNNLKNRLPIIETGDSIEHLSNTLNKMIHRIDEAYQQASRFSADASHELRTPLTVMRGELESIIIEPSLTTDIEYRMGAVLEETVRLITITEGLFAISRLDAGEARMQTVPVDIANLAKTTLEQIRLLAEEKHININCDIKSEIWVKGDPSRLKQVIVNLLDNAIKYTANYGEISLNVFTYGKKAIVEVIDNGIGISSDDKTRIFERFYRADKARSRELGGAGLGLSIVNSICIAHNGTISVRSEEGNGSTFIVELPNLFG